jgi:competence protein ComEC
MWRVCLTGDIERAAETHLLATQRDALRADLVIAPHHGSASSSHADFIEAVSPSWVIYTNGYRNRFGHPHPEVESRYALAGAIGFRTDRDGAVTIRFDQPTLAPRAERQIARRYWHAPAVGGNAQALVPP